MNPTSTRTRDRAQLILVGGLALAVTIVVIALVLNSAIYSHNLASRSDSAASEALKFEEDTRHGVGGLLDSVNTDEAGDDFTGLQSDYGTGLESWEQSTRNWTASNGRAVSVTAVSEREGVRIVDDSGSEFYPATGTSTSWTVAKDVRVRRFEMEVSASGLLSEETSTVEADLVGSGAFTVVFDDGTERWEVAIYEDDDTASDDVSVTVHEDSSSTYDTCTVGRTEVIVDFTAGEVATTECEPLGFLSEYDGPYDVEFHNVDASRGSYELTVDRVINDPSGEDGAFTDAVDAENFVNHCSGPTFNPSTGSYPSVAPAIYSAEVETEFVGSDTIARSQQRVAPDEPGKEPRTPRVTEFDVTEETSGDGSYTVDWSVEDPNGNLETVTISVDGNADTVSVSGGSASGSTTVSGGSGSGDTIEITVEDDDPDPNTRSTTRVHDDDGSVGGCPA